MSAKTPLWFKWSFPLAPHMWCVGKKEERCSMGSLQVAKYNFLKEWESWKNWKFWVMRKSGTGSEKLGANCDNVWRGANWMWHCAKVAKECLLGQLWWALCVFMLVRKWQGGGWLASQWVPTVKASPGFLKQAESSLIHHLASVTAWCWWWGQWWPNI